LPLPIAPLSLSSYLLASLHAAPPHLSPLIFSGIVSPRLPFPSTIWTLIPLLLRISVHVFLVEIVFGHSWWEFFPCLLFFVIGVFSCPVSVLLLSATSVFFFHCVAFPSTVFQLSVSTGVVVGVSGRGMFWVSRLAGGGVGFTEVEVVMSWCGGYLIMRASSASWVVEVA
jgi:hypothetical protein